MFDSDTEQARTNRVFKLSINQYGSTNFDSRVKRIAQKYDSCNSVGKNGGNDDSDVSPTRNHNYKCQDQQNSYRSLSPARKSQLVAKGQRELMDMIRTMPESSYELSLKDIVEHTRITEHQLIEKQGIEEDKTKKVNRANYIYNYSNGPIKRNEGFKNGGFLLKMVFPIPWGSRNKKNRNSEMINTSSKVSPRPSMDGTGKISVDKEWWKRKKLPESEDRESGGSTGSCSSSTATTTTRSSSSRHGRSWNPGCWSFFRTGNGKSTE